VTSLNYRLRGHCRQPPSRRSGRQCQVDQAGSTCPTDRVSLFKWVDHTAILLTIFFGPECPLVQEEFKPLAGLLQDPEYFHNYTLVNWAALTWKAHLDAQAFFTHKGLGS
jgi:hypothetical protein